MTCNHHCIFRGATIPALNHFHLHVSPQLHETILNLDRKLFCVQNIEAYQMLINLSCTLITEGSHMLCTAVFFWLFIFKMKLDQNFGHFYSFRALSLNSKHHMHSRAKLSQLIRAQLQRL